MENKFAVYASIFFLLISAKTYGDLIDDLESIKDESEVQPAEKDEKNPSPDSKIIDPFIKKKNSTIKKPSSGKKPKNSDASRRRLPISLRSDGQATYTKNGGVVKLNKNVRISQGNLFFRSDRATAFFIDKLGQKIVDKVEIFGNVRLSKTSSDPKEKVKASGNRAYFFNSKRSATLIGNARLWQGGHLIKGTQITYDLDSGIVKVDRAEGLLQPEGGKNSKSK